MRFLLALILFAAVLPVKAQTPEKEINQQVWKTFIKAYNAFDTELFMSVYSKDVVRVPRDQKQILNFADYKKSINREYHFNKSYNIKANLEIRFTERIHTANTAYESGLYKISLIENTGKKETIYSKFTVIMKKEGTAWKIVMDADSAEGNTLSEKDFQAAKPLE